MQHNKLKTDEPDEEKNSVADENDSLTIKSLRQDLMESKMEIKQLSDELRRLRQNESSLNAENQILQSKMMHSDPLGGDEIKPKKFSKNIPKLSAPIGSKSLASATQDKNLCEEGAQQNYDDYGGYEYNNY